MNLRQRLRILLDSRRKTFSPPKQPLSKAIVQGYDRATGRYIIGQGGSVKVMPSLSTGAVAVGGGVNGGALGFDTMPHAPRIAEPVLVTAPVQAEPLAAITYIADKFVNGKHQIWAIGAESPKLIVEFDSEILGISNALSFGVFGAIATNQRTQFANRVRFHNLKGQVLGVTAAKGSTFIVQRGWASLGIPDDEGDGETVQSYERTGGLARTITNPDPAVSQSQFITPSLSYDNKLSIYDVSASPGNFPIIRLAVAEHDYQGAIAAVSNSTNLTINGERFAPTTGVFYWNENGSPTKITTGVFPPNRTGFGFAVASNWHLKFPHLYATTDVLSNSNAGIQSITFEKYLIDLTAESLTLLGTVTTDVYGVNDADMQIRQAVLNYNLFEQLPVT
ncbi:MAG: hypothetical protein AAF151_12075 [Cyanobacteria bacterium J06656_5]